MPKKLKPKKLVSVIVPAYKQEKSIKSNIENICASMKETRWDFEVIVVVDGFLDKTYEEAKKTECSKIKVYGYENNKGKGFAIRYGMGKANGDLICFIDAGTDINPNGISMVLEHMEWYDADIIIASKRHPVSKTNYPTIRRIYSSGYHALVKMMFGLPISDTQTGLKVFKRNVLEKVLPRLLVKHFAFDIEILSVSKHLGYKKIYEAPVMINWDSANTNFGFTLIFDRHIRHMLIDTAAVFYRLKVLRYYDDKSKRKWIYDKELELRVNTGEFTNV